MYDVNWYNWMKAPSGEKLAILCYRVSSPFSRLAYGNQRIRAGDLEMARYEHAAQPHRTPSTSMDIIGAEYYILSETFILSSTE